MVLKLLGSINENKNTQVLAMMQKIRKLSFPKLQKEKSLWDR